jgi:hypothetical protein
MLCTVLQEYYNLVLCKFGSWMYCQSRLTWNLLPSSPVRLWNFVLAKLSYSLIICYRFLLRRIPIVYLFIHRGALCADKLSSFQTRGQTSTQKTKPVALHHWLPSVCPRNGFWALAKTIHELHNIFITWNKSTSSNIFLYLIYWSLFTPVSTTFSGGIGL